MTLERLTGGASMRGRIMSTRRKVLLAVAMTTVMVVAVVISVVAASLAWQEWEKGQWELSGIFAVAAAVFLAATSVLGYQMFAALRRKRGLPA